MFLFVSPVYLKVDLMFIRLVVDLMKRERKEGQGVVQNDHASWVHPDQNNLVCPHVLFPVCSISYGHTS